MSASNSSEGTSQGKADAAYVLSSDDGGEVTRQVPMNVHSSVSQVPDDCQPGPSGSGSVTGIKTKAERKKARNSGQAYVSATGKSVEARKFQLIGECRMKCRDRVSPEVQLGLFNAYWKMASRNRRAAYIAGLIEIGTKQRERKRRGTPEAQRRRVETFEYFLPMNGRAKVCKACFKTIFCETDSFLAVIRQQKLASPASTSTPDKRGRHAPPHKISEERRAKMDDFIKSLPVYESHYCRASTSKRYLPSHFTLNLVYQTYKQEVQDPVSRTVFAKCFAEHGLKIKKPA